MRALQDRTTSGYQRFWAVVCIPFQRKLALHFGAEARCSWAPLPSIKGAAQRRTSPAAKPAAENVARAVERTLLQAVKTYIR